MKKTYRCRECDTEVMILESKALYCPKCKKNTKFVYGYYEIRPDWEEGTEIEFIRED